MQLNHYTLSVLYYIMFIASLKMNNLLLQPSILQFLHAFTFAADMEFEEIQNQDPQGGSTGAFWQLDKFYNAVNRVYLHCGIAVLNKFCTTFSTNVCVCVCVCVAHIPVITQRGRETEAGRNKCALFFRKRWHLMKEEGMNRCTLFMRLTGVPERSLPSPLHWQASTRSSPDLLRAVHLSPPSPVPQPQTSPQYLQVGPHRRLQQRARDPIKKATLCVVFSRV